jgi:GAF domain-containing protein
MRKGEWSGELELRTANGKRVPAIQSYFLILDQHHQPRYLANITTDITERKQAELELSEQLRELNALQNTLRREGWRTFKPALAEGYFFDQIDLESLPSEWATSLQETVLDTGAERITLHPDEQSVVLAPLSTYDEALGVLGLHEDPENPLSADEMALVEAISEQVSLALENARLVEQTQAAVAENERLYRGSGRVISATTIDQILRALIDSTILNELDQAGILLFDRPLAAGEKPESFEVVAFWECQSNPLRQFMPTLERLDDFPAHYFMGRDDGPYLVVDTETEPSLEAEDRQYLTAQLGVRSLAVWPLVVGESWFGALSAQSSRPFQIRVEAIRQVNSLVDQAATTIQNRRLFRQTQEALSETEMLYEFSQELMTTTNLDQVLQVAAGPSIDRGANRITLISFEQGSTGQLEWAQIEAAWAEQQDVSDTVGTRWYLADHLLSRFWLADPDHPRLIGDIENEPGQTEVVRHNFGE